MTSGEIRRQLIDVRDEYINLIKSELLGPGSEFSVPDIEHELISSSPMSRYSIGILYPQGNQSNQDNDETVPINEDEDGGASEYIATDESLPEDESNQSKRKNNRNYEFDETANENLDEEIELSSQYMPSLMGVTFIVKGAVETVQGKVSFATYRNAKIPDCMVPYTPVDGADNYVVPSELSHLMAYDWASCRSCQ